MKLTSPRALSKCWLFIVSMALVLAACGGGDDVDECSKDSDCLNNDRCILHSCEPRPFRPDGSSADGADGENNIPLAPSSCPEGTVPGIGDVVINEIHAAPLSAEDDVDCDGDLKGSSEEFIEIVNTTDKLLDLSNVQLRYDRDNIKHTFARCLNPGSGIVVYGKDFVPSCDLGPTETVVLEDKGLSLSNSGEKSLELRLGSEALDELVYPNLGSSNASWTRVPDFTGDFKSHADIPLVETRFSVGTCVDGSPLALGCLPPVDPNAVFCEGAVAPISGALRINEVHAAPQAASAGGDDVNCDGETTSGDEFIELVNNSGQDIDLAGVQLQYDGVSKHFFTAGCLSSGRGLVIYNQQLEPMCESIKGEGTQMIKSSTSFSLTNAGKSLALVHGEGDAQILLEELVYPDLGTGSGNSKNSSWTRVPDFTGDFKKHGEITNLNARYSVGKCIAGGLLELGCEPPAGLCDDGVAPITGQLKINEIHAAPDAASGEDVDCDGILEGSSGEFIELVNTSDVKLDLEGVEVRVDGATKMTLSGCLTPGHGMVVYNKGLVPSCNFDAETLQVVATTSLSLTNSGKDVELVLEGQILESVYYGDLGDSTRDSWTRFPDFSGDFIEHMNVPFSGLYSSPGLCVSGEPLSPNCSAPSDCGNGVCDPGESFTLCPADCEDLCSNGTCDVGEDFASCSVDCPTCDDGNGTCDAGEDINNCAVDCACGDGVCGVGEDFGNCAFDCDTCGNGTCDAGEDFANCNSDCNTCGNGTCDFGETLENCSADCDLCFGALAASGRLVINEVHPAPDTTDMAHDANCDGDVGSTADEFVEFVNNSADIIMVEGVDLRTNGTIRFDFAGDAPDVRCLQPYEAVVIYGGGVASCDLGASTHAFVSSVSLTNSPGSPGREIALYDGGLMVDSMLYDNAPGSARQSLVRSPDYTGGAFELHGTADVTNGADHSAGLCTNGNPFPSCAP